MNRLEKGQISRRERQILDIIYRLGEATAQEVQDNLPDPPSYSAVRALLVNLENKELVKHIRVGRRYLYQPVIGEDSAKRSALKNLLGTFFQGKPENLVAALLDPKDQKLSPEEIENIRSLIDDK
ncbi:BlaI/MecI/CopY family transcriptional regulator [Roseibacillus ishigakijimensis]|uniref:BlaI/MecI/CopY family transcriptional regulator n=1 Tax=Roseibacillus ishigakijimensis TaxID=454146 RepID=A0A934RPY9_9BACT|nr:BlaI/MecI/CopY family transcriptional regulator [Roseibacillus ishigakijimensis]MBK1833697.1 BlaI/MecI/CopY family transcriptional regulator [Roseibacillus ishigakijimensis]